jgi:hypothetical protein
LHPSYAGACRAAFAVTTEPHAAFRGAAGIRRARAVRASDLRQRDLPDGPGTRSASTVSIVRCVNSRRRHIAPSITSRVASRAKCSSSPGDSAKSRVTSSSSVVSSLVASSELSRRRERPSPGVPPLAARTQEVALARSRPRQRGQHARPKPDEQRAAAVRGASFAVRIAGLTRTAARVAGNDPGAF